MNASDARQDILDMKMTISMLVDCVEVLYNHCCELEKRHSEDIAALRREFHEFHTTSMILEI